tara:strand:+ start:278 stop:454 length:177 start_codon:yes stop_codon:yes gene_type:complete
MINNDKNIIHVPTEMKHWEDVMYDAEFDDKWRVYHEAKGLYLHYKELHEKGIEHEPTF